MTVLLIAVALFPSFRKQKNGNLTITTQKMTFFKGTQDSSITVTVTVSVTENEK